MNSPVTTSDMRRVVMSRFQHHTCLEIRDGDVDERVRIDRGRVVAYGYRVANLFAMWMIEIGLVQFYDDQGNMLETLELVAPSIHERRAA